MKTAHWTIQNGSGMHRVAESLVRGEQQAGLGSVLCDPADPATWEAGVDADVHVCHTHIPDTIKGRATKPWRTVYVGHGTPEHIMHQSIEHGLRGAYGHPDGWMLLQRWLNVADAVVTFWPRHAAIFRSLVHRGQRVREVPFGVERDFWQPGATRGKYAGAPSVLTAENQHYIKWIWDTLIVWPWVTERLPEAQLHALYVPKDQHRYWFPLANANGSAYRSHISPIALGKDDLRNAFRSVDFLLSPVRYGDHNRLSCEAAATGVPVISYAGNVYATHWLPEGDQRVMADALVNILEGKAEPRVPEPVPDIAETVAEMVNIYREVCA